MSILAQVIALIQDYSSWAYVILFLGAFFETLIGPGFFIYGEFFFLAGSILAGAGFLNIWLVAVSCILGGILGDSASFYIGRKYGHSFIKKFIKKENKYFNEKNYKKGTGLFNKYGAKSVFFARFLGPMSWITPFIAGVAGIKYKNFLKYNIPGVILGIGQFLVVGYFFGFSYLVFLKKLEKYILYLLIVVAIIVLFIIFKNKILTKMKNGKTKRP